MSVKLYDLSGANDERFSPFCWRARMAVAHKGLDAEVERVHFLDVPKIEGGTFSTVPALNDNGTTLQDSFAIAEYLEETYPDAPALFGSAEGLAYAKFLEAWTNSVLHPIMIRMIVLDIHDILTPEDQVYFRKTREKRFGQTLESMVEGREERLKDLRNRLRPLRLMLADKPFLGGDSPKYTDYVFFGTMQWSRIASSFDFFEGSDPINEWYDRCLDLHGGIGRVALTK